MAVNRELCFLSRSDPYLSTLAVGTSLTFTYKEVRKDLSPSTSMDAQRPEEQIGGTPVRATDCYIWAAIYYLDSATGYREYLPRNGQKVATPPGDLVMLGDKRLSPWIAGLEIIIGAGFAGVVLPLIMRACQ